MPPSPSPPSSSRRLGGADIATGDDGDDRFETRDGVRDTINGGAGTDSAARDAIDRVVG